MVSPRTNLLPWLGDACLLLSAVLMALALISA